MVGMDPLHFLALVRARLVRSLVVEGVARVLAIAVTAAVLAVAADWQWHLPGGIRLALLGAVLAAAWLVAWVRLVRPFRRDLGDAAMASFVERRMPVLNGLLLTRIEGIALGPSDEQRLAQQLAAADLRHLVPASRTPKQVAVTAGAIGAVLLATVFAPQVSWDGSRRLLLPLSDVEWSRHTTLSAHLEHAVAASDAALLVVIERTHPQGDFSAPVEVAWRGGRIDEVRQLQGLTGTSWSTAISAPPGTYEITVSSADATPQVLSGRIVNHPTIARLSAILTPPAYTGLPEQTTGTVAGTVVPGTHVRFAVGFALDAGREITTAQASFTSGSGSGSGSGNSSSTAEVALTVNSEGRHCGEFVVRSAGSLVLSGSDQDGIGLASAARFPLTITPDRPPVISLSGPAARETVTVRAEVAVAVAASDDFGLGQVTLRSRTLSGEPDKKAGAAATDDSVEREHFTGVAGQLSITRSTVLKIGSFAAEGQQLSISARATDQNDVSGPGVSDSEAVVFRVVPEELLRQEFDRLLGEARDRVTQARDDVAAAADATHRAGRLRSAAQAAIKADELVGQVLRRWDQNRFPADGIDPGRKAHGVLGEAALPRLAEANAAAEAPLTSADTALAEAEKLLSSILQEGDLTRLLTSLIARQTAMNGETRGFVRAFLTKQLDPAGKVLQQNLSTRQRELADAALDLERRLLAKEGTPWAAAQDIVRKSAPGDQLRLAAQDVGTADRRPKAVDGQQAALASLIKLLDALRGGDANKDLAAKLGELAAEQEALAKELERGAPPGTLIKRQKDLTERTQLAQREAQSKDPEAAKMLTAATAAQQSAEKGMGAGSSAAATRDANAAAGLLREAQKKLGGEEPKKPDDKKDDKKVDIIALLKELRTLQAALVTDATLLDQAAGEKPLDFAAQRQLQALARTQGDLHLRLTEEGIKQLDKNPIARLALDRVAATMNVAQKHFATPALGAKGVRLGRQALAELARLIEVAENLPKPDKKDGAPPGDNGGGQAPQAAFPAQAEIALLATMQQEIAARTAAAHPTDLAADQAQLQHLVEGLARTARPDTRPAVLLERARRAMTSAAFQLTQQDRGALTRNEQHAAEAALRRLLAEAGGGGKGGGGGGGKPKPPPPQQSGGGQPPPPSPPAGGDGQGGTPAQAGGEAKPGTATTAALPVQATTTSGDLLELPPQIREQLRQAREQHFTPGQLHVYQRYLELLEDGK